MTPRFNIHGFINERGGDLNYGYTQIFRNGILEATKGNLIREHDGKLSIPGLGIEREFFQSFTEYINGLKDLDVPIPLIIMITFEGVKNVKYAISNDYGSIHHRPLIPQNILCLPECIIEEYGDSDNYHKAVRPAYDAFWNTIGYAKSLFYNEDGVWVGQS